MLYHKRRKCKLKRLKLFIICSLALLIADVVFCEYHLSDFRPEYIRTQAEILSANSVCDAVNETLSNLNYNYDDIAKIVYADDGSVQAIETDSFKINQIKSDVTKAVQREIAKVYAGRGLQGLALCAKTVAWRAVQHYVLLY